jgi:hypothetical protein
MPGLGLSRGRVDDLPGLSPEDDDLLRGAGGEPAAGSGGDEGGVLARAVALRFPDLRELAGREKVDALVDHIVATAILRGELEELRLSGYVRVYEVRGRLRAIPAASTRTRSAADQSRRTAAPDLAAALDDAQWLIDRCTEQINRLGGSDYDAASRAYTLLAG